MPRVVHFEINAEDPKMAVEFYKKVFGWKVDKWGGPMDYWLVGTGGKKKEPGIDGAIMKRDDPRATTYITIDVPSINTYLKRIEKGGGKVIAPRMPIPGVGFSAYFEDPDGNMVGLFERKKKR